MSRFTTHCCRSGLCLVALLVLGAAPAQAAWLGYGNDTRIVVVVQGSSTMNGRVRLGQPHQIRPRESAWDQVTAGAKTITVFDPAQRNRIIWQGQVNVGEKDQFFSIQAEMGADRQVRFKLVPVPVPAAMMPRRK